LAAIKALLVPASQEAAFREGYTEGDVRDGEGGGIAVVPLEVALRSLQITKVGVQDVVAASSQLATELSLKGMAGVVVQYYAQSGVLPSSSDAGLNEPPCPGSRSRTF
jgi:hypothetical protein